MSNPPPSRFTTGNQTTHERLTTNTVGLVALSDFRKRRAEVLEQQEREHYEFYFFIINKTLGPGNRPLFNYSVEAPPKKEEGGTEAGAPGGLLHRAGEQERAAQIQALEGAQDDPNMTKVVDRRWYERNKHIYPASIWQEYEPDKDYSKEVSRDQGGNTFFYSR
ncbi:XAP5 domain-containing protein [Magnaporthiopsis poae ATCC 64411]|uniref:XAP5 domain-containing protein n=1 Tax=Magnaporthiopsis poae (strain ATCC 64411 / 73-15) TaxID=644358 RepID=A0A0C4DNV5_MAGP6|nr:XAP5 domain-containing protein [Magnaporthiopsis poae ATCC 64411]